MTELSGNKVFLETVKPKDLGTIIAWSNKPRDSYFLSNSILPQSSEDLALELADTARELFLIKDNQRNPIGIIKSYNLNTVSRRALLAFSMQPSNNNTKLMQEAAELVLDRLFKKQNMTKLYVHCLPQEVEYKKVLSTLLFKKEGAYKEHLFINNTYYDLEIFGLNRAEYYR